MLPDAVDKAVQGMDAVVYMVMPALDRFDDVILSYDLNLKGLHLVLTAARKAGISRAVYASTGSVHHGVTFFDSENLPCDSPNVYGFTKGLGERVCQWFCQWH